MKRALTRIIITIIANSIIYSVQAQSSQGEDLEQLYGSKDVVSIATGTKQPISRAPSVASVITYDQMKAMGARDINDVLETVPGLHVSQSSADFNPIYSIRGIYTENNAQVLMLVNGVPINQLFLGNRGPQNILPIENISRIEVIRGPGSAIYGADAFAGVINIVTKGPNEINGTKSGVRAGSFDSQRAWLLQGGHWLGMKEAFTVEWYHTDGDNGRFIQQDAQTMFDRMFKTNASLAPGPASTGQKRVDLHLDVSKGNFTFHAWNWRQYDIGLGPGIALALDNKGYTNTNNYLVDLTYHDAQLSRNWDLTTRLSYMYINAKSLEYLYPPGAALPIGPNGNINLGPSARPVSFPDGLIGQPAGKENHARFNIFSFYNGFRAHRIRVGAGIAFANLVPSESKNFGPGVINGTQSVVNGSLTDVTNTPYIYIEKKERTDYYASLQDEWSFARDWSLTSGVRYDHYTNFGDTVNPRLALVWQTRYDLTTKLLYGRAFRAPSFSELYTINNPIRVGNPNLKPETINTYEIAFDYNPTFNVHTTLNIFHYRIRDLILLEPTAGGAAFTTQNAGGQSGHGLEWQVDWNPMKTVKLTANYAFQRSINKNTHSAAGNAPEHQLYARLNWQFLPQWSFVPQINWVMDRQRVSGDPRPPINNYAIVDMTLRRVQIAGHVEVALLAHNIFNANAREPSPYGAAGALIPYDFPLPGRSIYGELRVNF